MAQRFMYKLEPVDEATIGPGPGKIPNFHPGLRMMMPIKDCIPLLHYIKENSEGCGICERLCEIALQNRDMRVLIENFGNGLRMHVTSVM